LRILLLYEAVYPDNIGGVETRNWELGRALGRRGHEVTLAGFCAPLPGEPPNVRVLPMGPSPRLYNAGGRRSTRAALRFAAAVARLDLSPYDVVETANMPYVHLLPLALRCRLEYGSAPAGDACGSGISRVGGILGNLHPREALRAGHRARHACSVREEASDMS